MQAGEAIHIGDSYQSDVLGARKVGIKPILVQRNEDSDMMMKI